MSVVDEISDAQMMGTQKKVSAKTKGGAGSIKANWIKNYYLPILSWIFQSKSNITRLSSLSIAVHANLYITSNSCKKTGRDTNSLRNSFIRDIMYSKFVVLAYDAIKWRFWLDF